MRPRPALLALPALLAAWVVTSGASSPPGRLPEEELASLPGVATPDEVSRGAASPGRSVSGSSVSGSADPGSALPGAPASPGPGLPPMEGATWRLTDFWWRDQLRPVGGEITSRLRLEGGLVEGTSGCNAFGGAYALDREALSFGPLDRTEQGCEEHIMLVERALFEALPRVRGARLLPGVEAGAGASPEAGTGTMAGAADGPTLALLDAGGQVLLRYAVDDLGRLTDAAWELVEIRLAGRPIAPEPAPAATLAFLAGREELTESRATGTVSGSSGCRTFQGPWSMAGRALDFGQLDFSEGSCQGALGEQDAMVAEALAQVSGFRGGDDELVLLDVQGEPLLVYGRASPAEGITWVLTGLRGGPPLDATVTTLVMAEGTASGEGACGPYAGTYTLAGDDLSFDAIVSAPSTCAAAEVEAAYLDAIARAAGWSQEDGELVLLDRRGRELARFRQPAPP